jgi:hypothetical protein
MKTIHGWLDKFANGGELNYNDSHVFIPPNYEGIGYNTKGRNYSPAWNGQFEEGGKLPSQQERLKRQAFAESAWREGNIQSKAGALGPFQIMENAYTDYSKATGDNSPYESVQQFPQAIKVRNWTVDNISNSRFIKGKPQTEETRLAKIYAAYNWGKTNLANYLNKAKQEGQDIYNTLEWIDNLPKETKGYLDKVLFKKDKSFEKDFNKALKTHPNAKYFKKENGGEITNKFRIGDAIAEDGIELTKLDQLENWTNYNTPQKGGWLEQYK